MLVNTNYKAEDLELWRKYKSSPTLDNRAALLKRFDGVIQSQVNKWAGPVSRDVLISRAKLLAIKGFDSYNPNAGTALATHITNCLLPLSRTVYTYQNVARMPENITLKLNTYNSAVSEFKTLNGREPTTDELHNELGWSASELNRISSYNHKELVESGGEVSGRFFEQDEDDSDVILGGLYFELSPEEKVLFEHVTGYSGAPVLSNPALAEKLGINIAQLSYKKKLLKQKIEAFMSRPSLRRRFA